MIQEIKQLQKDVVPQSLVFMLTLGAEQKSAFLLGNGYEEYMKLRKKVALDLEKMLQFFSVGNSGMMPIEMCLMVDMLCNCFARSLDDNAPPNKDVASVVLFLLNCVYCDHTMAGGNLKFSSMHRDESQELLSDDEASKLVDGHINAIIKSMSRMETLPPDESHA